MFGLGRHRTGQNWRAPLFLALGVAAFSWYLRAEAPQPPTQQPPPSTWLTDPRVTAAVVAIVCALATTVAFLFTIGIKLALLRPEIIEIIKDRGHFLTRQDLLENVLSELVLDQEKLGALRRILLDQSEVARMLEKSIEEREKTAKRIFAEIVRGPDDQAQKGPASG